MIIDNNGMSWYSIVQLGRKEGFTEAELMASVDALAKGHMIENRGGSYVWINKSSMKGEEAMPFQYKTIVTRTKQDLDEAQRLRETGWDVVKEDDNSVILEKAATMAERQAMDDFDRKMLSKGKKFKIILPPNMGEPLYTDNFYAAKEMAKEYGKGTTVIDLTKSARLKQLANVMGAFPSYEQAYGAMLEMQKRDSRSDFNIMEYNNQWLIDRSAKKVRVSMAELKKKVKNAKFLYKQVDTSTIRGIEEAEKLKASGWKIITHGLNNFLFEKQALIDAKWDYLTPKLRRQLLDNIGVPESLKWSGYMWRDLDGRVQQKIVENNQELHRTLYHSKSAMRKIWYFDDIGKKHTFEAEDHSIAGILKEFKTIDKYLSSLGIKHTSCGVEGMPNIK